jgi:hypothetical protein
MNLRITELMDEIGMKKPRYKPFIQRGISYYVVEKYLLDRKKDMGLAHLEIFCLHLRCTPNDVFNWTPDPNHPVDKDHPLHQLSGRKKFNVQEELKKLTPEQIKKVFEDLKKADEGEKKD